MMKKYFYLFALSLLFSFNTNAQCPESFHDFEAVNIYGDTIQMSSFAGKKVLVVNTASFCGFTPQYADLQALYQTYGGSNFEIIGFPANNFGNQEPHGEDSIIGVCHDYGITFTMMSKISVKGTDQHEIYKWLTKQSRNCEQNATVGWNFHKFLINADGTWHASISTSTSPLHATIVNWITAPVSIENADERSQNISVTVNYGEIVIASTSEISEELTIKLFNTSGQCVEVLHQGPLSTEEHFPYSAKLNSGMYIIQITGKETYLTKKLVLL